MGWQGRFISASAVVQTLNNYGRLGVPLSPSVSTLCLTTQKGTEGVLQKIKFYSCFSCFVHVSEFCIQFCTDGLLPFFLSQITSNTELSDSLVTLIHNFYTVITISYSIAMTLLGALHIFFQFFTAIASSVTYVQTC